MKKILTILLVMVLCVATFASCAQTNNNNETDANQQAQQQNYGTPIKLESVEATSVNVGEEIATATFNVTHMEQLQVNKDFVKKLSKSLRKNYVETFAEQFPSGIHIYEEMETSKLKLGEDNYFAVKGRINEGFFLVIYKTPKRGQGESMFTSSSVNFTYEFTGGSAKIDEILQGYEKIN